MDKQRNSSDCQSSESPRRLSRKKSLPNPKLRISSEIRNSASKRNSLKTPPESLIRRSDLKSIRISHADFRLPVDPLPVFGLNLDAHLANYEPRQLSVVIETCVCAIFDKGIGTEGILRIPGTRADVDALKKEFDAGMKFNILKYDVHSIASALKLYLRELPEPLVPSVFYDRFLEITTKKDIMWRMERLGKLLNKLPTAYYHNLRYLIKFLNEITQHELKNKMNARALGICIGTNILRPQKQPSAPAGPANAAFLASAAAADLTQFGTRNTVAELLVVFADELFPNYDLYPTTLISGPGSLFLAKRAMSQNPTRFAELKSFFKRRLDLWRSGLTDRDRVAKQSRKVKTDGPDAREKYEDDSNRKVSQSTCDLRQTQRRYSSVSSAVGPRASKASVASLDSRHHSRPATIPGAAKTELPGSRNAAMKSSRQGSQRSSNHSNTGSRRASLRSSNGAYKSSRGDSELGADENVFFAGNDGELRPLIEK